MVPRCSWSFSSPWNFYFLGHFFVHWERFAVIGMTAECGRNTQQMVSYRGISDRSKTHAPLPIKGHFSIVVASPHIPRSARS
jgi:hypothetical protein